MTGIAGEVQVLVESFRWNEAEFRRLTSGHDGAAAVDLTRRSIRVEGQAKRNASGRPGPNVITGRLRGSITWRLGEDSAGLYADVGTAVHYAPFVERRYPFLVPAIPAGR